MARILIIDDEEPIRFSLRGILEDEGYEVLEAATAEEGLEAADAERPDLVFLDIWLPGMDGLTAQARLKGNHPDLPVVMISGHGTIETAVSAIQQGAYDFIEKPLSLEKVVIVAARALEAGSLRRENQVLRTVLPEQDELIGQSPVMLKFRELLARVAPTDVWVLLTGENGTGKELAARALHAGSRRADAPMIAVNCAAIPEELIESELFGHEKGAFTSADQARAGRFEMANNGTLFLDEIGDPHRMGQGKGGLLPPLPAHAFLFQMRPLEDGIFLNVGAGGHAEHFIIMAGADAASGTLPREVVLVDDLSGGDVAVGDEGAAGVPAGGLLGGQRFDAHFPDHGQRPLEILAEELEILVIHSVVMVVAGQRLVVAEVLFKDLRAEQGGDFQHLHVVGQGVIGVADDVLREMADEGRDHAERGVFIHRGVIQHAVE